jgi:hypothetical protein
MTNQFIIVCFIVCFNTFNASLHYPQAIPTIIKDLSKVEERDLHLSTDIWSSRRGDSIIAIMAHFVTDDDDNGWKLCAKALCVQTFNTRHTAVNILDKLHQSIANLKVDQRQVRYFYIYLQTSLSCY